MVPLCFRESIPSILPLDSWNILTRTIHQTSCSKAALPCSRHFPCFPAFSLFASWWSLPILFDDLVQRHLHPAKKERKKTHQRHSTKRSHRFHPIGPVGSLKHWKALESKPNKIMSWVVLTWHLPPWIRIVLLAFTMTAVSTCLSLVSGIFSWPTSGTSR